MNNEAYANIAAEFNDDCYNHRFAFNGIEEDKESFITNERARWTEKMARIFGDEPVVEPRDPRLVGSSAAKVGSDIDLLSTHMWPKLDGKSQDKLLIVCKKWGKEISTILNFPRPQRMNWTYAKSLVISCTQSSLKVVRMEEGQNDHQGRLVHFKCMCQLWNLLVQEHFLSWMYVALINRRYAWNNSYQRNIFEARFNNSPKDGYYFGVSKSSAGSELEASEYDVMVETVYSEYLQMLSLDESLFN